MEQFPTREQVLDIIEQHAPEKLKPILGAHLKPAIAVLTTDAADSEIVIGTSKIGGAPDLPHDFNWPVWNEKPLGFVAQFDLSEVHSFDLQSELPSSGLLSFFYAIEDQPWGFPKDAGAWKVFYWPEDVAVTRRDFPEVVGERNILPSCAVGFAVEWLWPDLGAAEMVNVELDVDEEEAEEQEAYYALIDAMALARPIGPRHRLLGFADAIQDDVPYSCYIDMFGEKKKEDEESIDFYKRVLQEGADQWRLLFQLDSYINRADLSKGWNWGDAGMIYFCIHQDDLKARRFDDVWLQLQCG